MLLIFKKNWSKMCYRLFGKKVTRNITTIAKLKTWVITVTIISCIFAKIWIFQKQLQEEASDLSLAFFFVW